jgi:hypothetical protein
MAVPDRSLDQRRAALVKANEVRMARARLKAAIFSGDVSPVDVLLDPPAEAQTMRVMDLLLSIRQFGPSKVQMIFGRFSRGSVGVVISPSKTVGGLTKRQREVLADYLIEWEGSNARRRARRTTNV